MYRLFVAVDMPEELKSRLADMGFGLPGAKWVPREQIHLTLRFIGEVDGGQLADIRETLAGVGGEPFAMQLKGMGFFPPRGTPRVLWVGVEENEALLGLRNRVEAAVVRAGLQPESRRFSAHVTLARLHNTPPARLSRFLAGNGLYESPPFEVKEFCLYESELTPKGAIHHLLESFPLR